MMKQAPIQVQSISFDRLMEDAAFQAQFLKMLESHPILASDSGDQPRTYRISIGTPIFVTIFPDEEEGEDCKQFCASESIYIYFQEA